MVVERFPFQWLLICKFGIVERNFILISCLYSCLCTYPCFAPFTSLIYFYSEITFLHKVLLYSIDVVSALVIEQVFVMWCGLVFIACTVKNCQKCGKTPKKCVKCKAGYKKNKKGQCGMSKQIVMTDIEFTTKMFTFDKSMSVGTQITWWCFCKHEFPDDLLTDGRTGSSLVQIMACCLLGVKLLSKPMMTSHQWYHREQASMKKYRNKQILVHESHLNLSFVILPPICHEVEALNNNPCRTGSHGLDAGLNLHWWCCF